MTTSTLINLLHGAISSHRRTHVDRVHERGHGASFIRMGIKDHEAKDMACHSCSDEIAEKVLAKVGQGDSFGPRLVWYAYTWKLERLVGPRAIEGLQLCLSTMRPGPCVTAPFSVVSALTTISHLMRTPSNSVRAVRFASPASDTLETVINEVISNLREHGAVPHPRSRKAPSIKSDFLR